jgi:hypothetical protein
VSCLALRRDDLLMLCSNRLSSRFDDAELRRILTSTGPLDEACAALGGSRGTRPGDGYGAALLAFVQGDDFPRCSRGESVMHTFMPAASPNPFDGSVNR